MIMSLWFRDGGWRWALGAALATGVMATHLPARAHISNYGGSPDCGAHGYTTSKGGSVFSNCNTFTKTNAKGRDVQFWTRDIDCAAGTGCANALCGSGYSASGWVSQSCEISSSVLLPCSWDSTYAHGVPGVSSLSCY